MKFLNIVCLFGNGTVVGLSLATDNLFPLVIGILGAFASATSILLELRAVAQTKVTA